MVHLQEGDSGALLVVVELLEVLLDGVAEEEQQVLVLDPLQVLETLVVDGLVGLDQLLQEVDDAGQD
ncbi:MAG: hypothetical protein ACMG6E_09030 [Candidatus Roizmanbacteria bacterium]